MVKDFWTVFKIFRTVLKISKRIKKNLTVWKISGQPARFLDCLENFQRVWKLPEYSWRFPNSMEDFRQVWRFPEIRKDYWTVWVLCLLSKLILSVTLTRQHLQERCKYIGMVLWFQGPTIFSVLSLTVGLAPEAGIISRLIQTSFTLLRWQREKGLKYADSICIMTRGGIYGEI